MQDIVANPGASHKILGPRNVASFLWNLVVLGICCWTFFALNLRQNPALVTDLGLEYTDADCYSRMTRVGILGGEERFQNFRQESGTIFLEEHSFENFPVGTTPHTTAPMDWAILLLSKVPVPVADPIGTAGYVISFLLGILFLIGTWLWGMRIHCPFRSGMLLLLTTSPILLHAFAFGRPDHQSLVLLLTGFAICAEALRWKEPGGRWWAVAGVLWGLALWVSWFEPLVLLLVVCGFRGGHFLAMKKAGTPQESRSRILGALGFTFAIALLSGILEGFPIPDFSAESRESFFRWGQTVGELRGGEPWTMLPIWMGWLGLLVPFFLAVHCLRKRCVLCAFWLVLFVATFALTAWHMRWSYFLVLIAILSVPWALGSIRWRAAGWAVFVICLWPLAEAWEKNLFPDRRLEQFFATSRLERRDLREAGEFLRTQEGTGIVAPWWQTPALVYHSGKHGVAGSSHQSLPGIEASARIFSTENPKVLRSLLMERNAEFLVIGDAENVLRNATDILGKPADGEPILQTLSAAPSSAPDFLIPIFQNQTFRIYRIRANEL